MEEYRLELRVKNNLICSKIEKLGYKSVSEFCRAHNLKDNDVGDYINMRRTPLKYCGGFKEPVIRLAEALNCAPEDLFSYSQLHNAMKTNKHVKQISEAEAIFALSYESAQEDANDMDDMLLKLEINDELMETINTQLTPREQRVITARFGLNGQPPLILDEIAKEFGFKSREYVRIIETKALRKLRRPRCSAKLIELMKN